MKIIDPGHLFELTTLDQPKGDPPVNNNLQFVKRQGEKYPGNLTSYPGTNIQEVIRALISRLEYLNTQVPCNEDTWSINHLRSVIYLLERRAADRHDRKLDVELSLIEHYPTCKYCGHIQCYGACRNGVVK